MQLADIVKRPDGSCILKVLGADLVDGTPIYDIKPYLPYTDSHPEAKGGWTDTTAWPEIREVAISPELYAKIPDYLRPGLMQVLRQDPRPAYTRRGQESREFWVPLGSIVARFVVLGNRLLVTHIDELSESEMKTLSETGSLPELQREEHA